MVADPIDEFGDEMDDEGDGGNRPQRPVSPLRYLYDTSVQIERVRIGMTNRLSAINRGADTATREVPPIYGILADTFVQMEDKLEAAMVEELRANYPVYTEWLQHVKGIGPALSSQLLALLLPPLPDKGPSSWWKAAGLYVEDRPDGTMRIPRARRGEGKTTYHRWLRRCLFNVGESFVRTGGYYREVYEERKRRLFRQHSWRAARALDQWESTGPEARKDWLEATYGKSIAELSGETAAKAEVWALNPSYSGAVKLEGVSDETWPLIRIDRVARWITIKLFLAHLYEQWCIVEDIERKGPYIQQYGDPDQRHHFIPAPTWTRGQGKI